MRCPFKKAIFKVHRLIYYIYIFFDIFSSFWGDFFGIQQTLCSRGCSKITFVIYSFINSVSEPFPSKHLIGPQITCQSNFLDTLGHKLRVKLCNATIYPY